MIFSLYSKTIDSSFAVSYKPVTMISYKEYAALKIESNKQFKCLSQLYGKESAWNPLARNGSHYGIPQGKSEYLSRVNGYKQIDWGLSYIAAHRLYGVDDEGYINACAALKHFKTKGWH
jgi:hypothetical protein